MKASNAHRRIASKVNDISHLKKQVGPLKRPGFREIGQQATAIKLDRSGFASNQKNLYLARM
jgi:hypothetical protein